MKKPEIPKPSWPLPRSSCGPRFGSTTTTRGAWSPKRFANGLKNSADSTTWESAEIHSGLVVMAFSSSALRVLPFADRFEHKLLGVLDKRPTQVSCRLEPVDGTRQDHTARTLPVELRVVNPRGDFAGFPQRLSCPHQMQAGADDHDVARAEVLLRAVIDRPHTLGDRLILKDDTGEAGVACASLCFLAVEQVVIAGISLRSGAPVPV